MNVLVIAEDYRHDQYILKPLVHAMLTYVGRPRANVEMCRDPMLRGWSQVKAIDALKQVVSRNAMADLFLLLVDRDGTAARRDELDAIERRNDSILLYDRHALMSACAHQEVEVWLLAGHDLPSDWSWSRVRQHPNPKEVYYQPFAQEAGAFQGPGRGRKRLGEAAARRYDRIRQLCAEIQDLETRLKQWTEAT